MKTLILIDHDQNHVFNASACGNNCAKWLLEIGRRKDVLVRLGYPMNFGGGPFSFVIENTGHTEHSMREMVTEMAVYDLLKG